MKPSQYLAGKKQDEYTLNESPMSTMSKSIVVITPKDIQRIMGNCYKTAGRIHRRIRKFTGKRRGQVITIDDFCDFTGLTHENVQTLLKE